MTDRTCIDCGGPIEISRSQHDYRSAYEDLQRRYRKRCDACVAVVVQAAEVRRQERAQERMLRGRPALVEARDVVETVQRAIV